MRSFISPSLLLIVKVPDDAKLSGTVTPNIAPQPSVSTSSSLAVKYSTPGTEPLS
jgi:hypothetical protein